MGLIVRTAGVGKSADALQWDLSFRLKHWEAIKSRRRPPCTVPDPPGKQRYRACLPRLSAPGHRRNPDRQPENFDLAKEHTLRWAARISAAKSNCTAVKFLCSATIRIESQIESAFQREVRLPSGGSIVIDSTEALTAIDINSARATRGGDIEETAFNTNLEAADEIVRQLRACATSAA